MNDLKYDKRTIKRNLENGTISQKRYQKHLDDLADLKDECEIIDVTLYDNPEDSQETENEGEEQNEPVAETGEPAAGDSGTQIPQ